MSYQADRSTPKGITPPDMEDYARLIDRVRNGDQTGVEELSRLFSRGIRFLLSRQVPLVHVEQVIENTLNEVIRAIEGKEVAEPQQLLSFILKTVKRQGAIVRPQDAQAQRRVGPRNCFRNELAASECSQGFEDLNEITENVLEQMSETERRVLRRYYLDGDSPEAIQKSQKVSAAEFKSIMVKTRTLFRSLKHPDKSRFNLHFTASSPGSAR